MRYAILSDAHAAGPGDSSQDTLIRWLDELEADGLFLLGDVFHHWWGFEHEVMEPYRPLCDALGRVCGRGLPVVLVPGNHDFHVGRYLQEVVGIEVRAAHTVSLDGVRFLLAHGDEADTSGGYALTRRVLRGRPFAAAMQLLGPRRAWSVLARLAGASREHGGEPTALLEAQRAWARQQLEQGVDVVVMGHLHVPGVVHSADPPGIIVHMGAWVGHRTWLRVEDGVPTLVQGLSGEPWMPAR